MNLFSESDLGEISDPSEARYRLVSRRTLEYADKLAAAVMQRLARKISSTSGRAWKSIGMSMNPREYSFSSSLSIRRDSFHDTEQY